MSEEFDDGPRYSMLAKEEKGVLIANRDRVRVSYAGARYTVIVDRIDDVSGWIWPVLMKLNFQDFWIKESDIIVIYFKRFRSEYICKYLVLLKILWHILLAEHLFAHFLLSIILTQQWRMRMMIRVCNWGRKKKGARTWQKCLMRI